MMATLPHQVARGLMIAAECSSNQSAPKRRGRSKVIIQIPRSEEMLNREATQSVCPIIRVIGNADNTSFGLSGSRSTLQ